MTLDEVLAAAVDPALAWMPRKFDSSEARVMLLSIGLQESLFQHRRQMGNGPARGFWQFERGGGVTGVMTHPATRDLARAICAERNVPFVAVDVWRALEFDDVLAAVFARLNLWWAPGKLPAVTATQDAWNLYIFTWRPGKPHRKTWDAHHRAARGALALP